MSIDVSQFHQVFFEESFEGIEIMEGGLLNLELGAVDAEAINTIFRAAHSIKGGAGTFGFSLVAEFTHVMETLLDEMRAGNRPITADAVDLLLKSIDCLRDLLAAQRDQTPHDQARVSDLKQKLDAMLSNAPVPPAAATPATAPVAAWVEAGAVWLIDFKPYPTLLQRGNDPVRMFRELSFLGEVETTADTRALPAWNEFDPELVYLNWTLKLSGDASRAQVNEIFEWVDTECDLKIAAAAASAPVEGTASPAVNTEAMPPLTHAKAEPEAAGSEKSAANTAARKPAANADQSSIRVGIDKIDVLINLVGELVITQSMLSQLGEAVEGKFAEKLRDGLTQLARNTRELQQSVLGIRMLPISFSFNRFPRLVHDLSNKLGKQVELKLSGEQTELDKTVMEKISDPLVHLVRNSLDHGIETPATRMAAGKPETGMLLLNAYHEGGNIVIEITDDGAGLNRAKILKRARERGLIGEHEYPSDDEICQMIFMPGFSTADTISDVSGRGVGMDVVLRNIKALGGVVDVRSIEGKGSTFTIRLPLTLAILDGQLVRIGQHTYIVPIVSIIESLQVDAGRVNGVIGKAELYKLRDEYLPIVRLYDLFNLQPEHTELDKGLLVIVEGDSQRIGLFVDDLLSQQQVVIKSLETNYQRIEGISGATILGDGTVALILDLPGIIRLSKTTPPNTRARLVDTTQWEAA